MERVVLYTIPAIGHLKSMVELGKLLVANNPSLSLTVLTSKPSHDLGKVSSYISSVSSSTLSINFHFLPPVPLLQGDPSNYENVEHLLFETTTSSKPIIRDILLSLSSTSTVSAFILDFFCYCSIEVSKSLGLPTYVYFPSSASVLAIFLNFPVFDKIATDSFRNLGDTPFEIPGLFSVPASSMLEPVLDRGESYAGFVKMGIDLPKSDGIVINTFESLEPRAVKGLREGICLPGTRVRPPIYCIGPLLSEGGSERKGGERERHECLSWLDSQPSRSVVFLCFGSAGLMSKEQTREIADGLERSGVRFLWVVRGVPSEDKTKKLITPPEIDLDSILPSGFIERTKDRGLVLKSWAPQMAVLEHEAIGGFVTHCGWNSTLEAVCVSVPMVAWPLYAEQSLNKILLVEEIKIALPMNESENKFVKSDEIERRVKQVISSEEGDAIRKRVSELSHEAKTAIAEGGSSKVALAKLVESLKLKVNSIN